MDLKHVVSQEWLFEHGIQDHVVIADCRFILGQPEAGKQSYEMDHICGAVYFDLERDLSGPKKEHGGRHPLPDLKELAVKLGRAGIDGNSVVVAYDDQGGAMASRFWWLLKHLGHDKVYILDKGYSEWKEAGYPVTEELPVEQQATFTPKVRKEMLVNVEQVRDGMKRQGTVLVDSREEKRYLGIEETIDPVAGHIPGAKPYFWKEGLQASGGWKDASAQKARFADLRSADEIIVYCGSGVTACPNVLAFSEAGFDNVKLYAGSWSDWISYPENPVATGKE